MPHPLHRICPLPGPVLALTGLLVALFALVQVAGWEPAWRFDRTAIAAGESWRLLSGHFAHLNTTHLLLNAAGLALAMCLFGDAFSARGWLLLVPAISTVAGLGLWHYSPAVAWYVGFSGTLHGLFAAGSLAAALAGDRAGIAALLLLAGKLGWEQFHGDAGTAELIGATVVVDAHLYGFVGGLMLAPLARRRKT